MTYSKLKNLFEEQSLLNDINGILSWDMATYMPAKSRNQRKKQIKVLYDYKKKIFNEIKKNELFNRIEELKLDHKDRINIELMKDKFEYFETISFDRIQKKTSLSIECEGLWREAKEKSDFTIVKDSFNKLMKLTKEESEILSQKKQLSKYDCLLLKYDRSLNSKKLKKLFNQIEKFINLKLPIIEKNQKNETNLLDANKKLSEEEQFNLSKVFMKKLGFDFSKGRIDKSMHPFCGGSTDDVRITTRFDENDAFSCFDALMHETGHALYEQGLPSNWAHQPIGSAAGMSLHESQSLFIEKQIIKSLPVSKYLEKILQEKLGKVSKEWTSQKIFKSRNRVKKSFIRVDADEVTYPLHIIHRFNIECKIINENINEVHLPDLWNDEFLKIFGMKVDCDTNGCLQDIHWFGGDFGYFPTYSVGAFIAAQLSNEIKNQFPDLNTKLENGDFQQIIRWLRINIHQKGNESKINELLSTSTKEILNLKYFKNHIINRFINGNF